MGLYAERIFPWACDRAMDTGAIAAVRDEALAPARGEVLEIGFGTGLNLGHYPAAVTRLTAVEPSGGMLGRARERADAAPIPVTTVAAAGERLLLPDGAFDTVVTTFTLCSVDDPARVLAELRRVLRDDGVLLVAEHGLSPAPRVARLQHLLTPVQRAVACGCRLDRPIAALVAAAGFRFEHVRSFQLRRSPAFLGWVTVGAARKA